MSKQPRALELADQLEEGAKLPPGSLYLSTCDMDAARLLRRQHEVIAELEEALDAMLTRMSMDEDEWNRPTFDQARAAFAHSKELQGETE